MSQGIICKCDFMDVQIDVRKNCYHHVSFGCTTYLTLHILFCSRCLSSSFAKRTQSDDGQASSGLTDSLVRVNIRRPGGLAARGCVAVVSPVFCRASLVPAWEAPPT
ncbi:hypothetical protein LIA77_00297 [Sarocladium implicatum]|nr:hypothetical protein LIA77_00297 [Sarocladium implicatum]